jgi:hypothetical protein
MGAYVYVLIVHAQMDRNKTCTNTRFGNLRSVGVKYAYIGKIYGVILVRC